MKTNKVYVSLILVITMAFVIVSCSSHKEMNPEEFGSLLEKKLDCVLDEEPYTYSVNGDTRFYRIYEDINHTQVNASFDDVIIYYSYYESVPNAVHIYNDIFELFDSSFDKESGNRFSYFDEEDYDYIIYEGINPQDELYFYGEIFHIGHTIIYVYTNSDSDDSKRVVDSTIRTLGIYDKYSLF